MKHQLEYIERQISVLEKQKQRILDRANRPRKQDGDVRVYRYVRLPTYLIHSNMGGIAFEFKFKNPGEWLTFNFALCNFDENFDREIARSVIEEHPERAITIPYDREKSLVHNVSDYLFSANLVDMRMKQLRAVMHKLFIQCDDF